MLDDSGKRIEMGGGMVREPSDHKVNFVLTRDGPMYRRWAEHLTRGAGKYAPRNWMKCVDGTHVERTEVHARARESAVRHLELWLEGDESEDHAAAVFFNVNLAEYLAEFETLTGGRAP